MMKMVRKMAKNIQRLHSSRFVILLHLLLLIMNGGPRLAMGLFVDYADNTELIQETTGKNITLLCSTPNGVTGESEDDLVIKYLWYFMQCGENSGGSTNCYHSVNEDDWTQLPCEDNFCKPELELKNVTEKYSGLYKCKVIPDQVGAGGNVVVDKSKSTRIYQLEIRNASQKIPEFLDEYPLNHSVTLGSQAVLQCRVYCEEHPTIKWFRRLPPRNKFANYDSLHSIVHYNGRAYELLTAAREKSIGRDIYLSKLILNEVQSRDEGYYACVAISVRGHSIREAYLHVESVEYDDDDDGRGFPAYWSDYSEETDEGATSDPSEFWLLFLMPVGLAILPLTVWLCYIAHKRCRTASSNSEELLSIDHQRMLRK